MSELSFKVRTPPTPPRQVHVPFWLFFMLFILFALVLAAPAIAFLLLSRWP